MSDSTTYFIRTPDSPQLDLFCRELASRSERLGRNVVWPAAELRRFGECGIYEWFLRPEWGGQGWSDADLVRGYMKLSAACLTTSFVLTQRTAACVRIAASSNVGVKERLLPDLACGNTFATVAVSHLTTSRRHLAKPVLQATPTARGFVLNGLSPWVTGGTHAHSIVTGASLDDGSQILLTVPRNAPGLVVHPPVPLVGLSASATGRVEFQDVEIDREDWLAGPSDNVMRLVGGGGAGGVTTSALAAGLADAAINFLDGEARARPDLVPPARALREEWERLRDDLLQAAGGIGHCSNEELRSRANSLVLRATQSALAAAKGTGYVTGHPAGRWCQEALFFLVWSCPQPVLAANLCELAGL